MQTPNPTPAAAERDGVIWSAMQRAAADRCPRHVWRVPASDLPASYFHRHYRDRNVPRGAVLAAVIGVDGTVRWQDGGDVAPVPAPSPAADALAGHHAQLEELEAHGRDVLRRFTPAQLATALYSAVYVSQLEGRLGDIELDPVEDLAALIQRAEHDDEQARTE